MFFPSSSDEYLVQRNSGGVYGDDRGEAGEALLQGASSSTLSGLTTEKGLNRSRVGMGRLYCSGTAK
jgi:hypothetical protein